MFFFFLFINDNSSINGFEYELKSKWVQIHKMRKYQHVLHFKKREMKKKKGKQKIKWKKQKTKNMNNNCWTGRPKKHWRLCFFCSFHIRKYAIRIHFTAYGNREEEKKTWCFSSFSGVMPNSKKFSLRRTTWKDLEWRRRWKIWIQKLKEMKREKEKERTSKHTQCNSIVQSVEWQSRIIDSKQVSLQKKKIFVSL